MRRFFPFIPALALALALVLAALQGRPSQAQSDGGGRPGGPAVIDITSPRREPYKIAVPRLIGDSALGSQTADIVSGDLATSGWFRVLDPHSFLARLEAEGLGIVVGDWRNVGAEGVSKGSAVSYSGEISMDFKLYEVARGARPVLERSYKGPESQARAFAHAWSAEVVRYFAQEDSFFNTQIAYVSAAGPGRADVYAMDYDGANVRRITDNGSQNILPAWSPSGGQIAYTSFVRGNPDLYLVPAGGGRARRIAQYPGVNMGAAFSPDGSQIAITLSQDDNSEIYLLSINGTILKRLTDNPFIDSSPAWSPDGAQLAFVSNRHGSPQIWTMSSSGANQQRLTRQGNYNQEPAWCPRCREATIAFTGRDEKGVMDIFTISVMTGEILRLTEGQGRNEHASWAPNGRALAYASTKGGIWVTTADGRFARQVRRGDAITPAWGPASKR